MQAQGTKPTQATITSGQSLVVVQTLLKAGLGCISFLRDLLPQDNFSTRYLTSSDNTSLSPNASQDTSTGSFRNVSGFKFTTIKRDWSAEGNRVLDYLEKGIFDALEKQYLRSFIFAIYLDEQDRNNIVEAYTFNFKYHRIPGTDTVVPIMSLGKGLMNMSLGGNTKSKDPVTQASLEGRTPTLGEVKKSIKDLVKTLISTINNMDKLPKRRFATFKVFYHSHTPDSYEPPEFVFGDPDKDHFIFTTHERDEVPEKWKVGNLETGWHGVDLHVASVTSILPTEKNDALFSGTADRPRSTLAQSARRAEVEAQKRDAHSRKIVWDAERVGRMDSLDYDAEGSPDPEYPEAVNDSGVGLEPWVPIGYRAEDGAIVPLSLDERRAYARSLDKDFMDVDNSDDITTQELHFMASEESVPKHIEDMRQKELRRSRGGLPQTQELRAEGASSSVCTLSRILPPVSQSNSPLPPSDPDPPSSGVYPQMDVDSFPGQAQVDDLGTQTQPTPIVDDPIESFPNAPRPPLDDSVPSTPKTKKAASSKKKNTAAIECDCGVTPLEDAQYVQCEGSCGKWYHIWCMGYHDDRDKRLPKRFMCFHCRVENDDNWEYVRIQPWFAEMVDKFPRLALFRRAIKLAEYHEPETLKEFTELIGCERLVAGQLFKRLETEGFIAPEADLEFGLDAILGKKGKGNGKKKQPKQRKNMRKAKYTFVKSVKREGAYRDYFNPDMNVQMRVMGVNVDQPASTSKRQAYPRPLTPEPEPPQTSAPVIVMESQTQAETQFAVAVGGEHKRKAVVADPSRVSKRLKMSVAREPVDLRDR